VHQLLKVHYSKRISFILALILVLLVLPPKARADNLIGFDMTCMQQHDTIYAGQQTSLEMSIENDVHLGGINFFFEITSADGATWQWGGNRNWYEFVPGSRMPDGSIWDMGVGWPMPYDTNGISPDTITHGGVAMMVGLPPGPLEHMLSYNLVLDIPEPEGVYELCIDSIYVPPSGAFIFVDKFGNAFPPTVLWNPGGACWPVKVAPLVCGDLNSDGQFNVGDPIFLIAFIFAGGTEPENFWLGDANGDGDVDIGDAVYMLVNIFQFGPDPICP
jgi:hypothetical protein